jgi:hypothetical protein
MVTTLTTVEEKTTYYYPNKMGRIVLLAMEEVMGRNGVNAVLNLAKLKHLVNNYPPNNFDRQFTFEEVGAIQQALDEMYGPRGGRGLALRAGRMCFKVGFEVFAETFNKFTDQTVRLGEDETRFLWIIERCPVCWGRRSNQPCCHLAVGILQESLYWVSGGKNFEVEEITCIAQGDPTCTIAIEKQPLD